MADFLSELASGVGLEDEQAQHGVGALLSTLKSKLDPEAFAHLKNSIPNCEEMVSASPGAPQFQLRSQPMFFF